jgi:hypothetical protein
MPDTPPLSGADFYDALPTADHRTGDIWTGLPTFGMLGRATVPGIVITPACDLAQCKSETVTYLPIIPVGEYLASAACRHECWQEAVKVLEKLPSFAAVFPPPRFELVSDEDLEALIGAGTDTRNRPLAEHEMLRIQAYKRYVKASRSGIATIAHVKDFFKADRFETMTSRLVANAFKPDIHFLPADALAYGARPVPAHSVVLFRYPLTVPAAVLDVAQHSTEAQWKSPHQRTGGGYEELLTQMPEWPVKLASLKNEFLSDLISRYLGVHIRLGSADFTEQTIRTFCDDIRG